MESFFTLLERRVDDCSSLLCVGLDPHLPDLRKPTPAGALEFCLRIIEGAAEYAAAFKPNAAFFEVLGPEGWAVLEQVIQAVHVQSRRLGSHIPVILDAKRGDVASTAQAYAVSTFERLGADAITLSPFLGSDSIEPFVQDPERGVFLLCKTSNPSASELQDVLVASRDGGKPVPLYHVVARLAEEWNTRGNIGLVVGATHLRSLAEVRAIVPEMWILCPGVGPQGGDLEAVLRSGLRPDKKGLLVNVSRALSGSGNPRRAAASFRDQMAGFVTH
jgi:uridine monophosphate synthetase